MAWHHKLSAQPVVTTEVGQHLSSVTLAKHFYQLRQQPYFWLEPGQGEGRRAAMRHAVETGGNLGIVTKSRFPNEAAIPPLTDTAKAKVWEQSYTLAALDWCRTLTTGAGAAQYIRNDEVTPLYSDSLSLQLVRKMATLNSTASLDSFLNNLEPATKEYLLLKQELVRQQQLGNQQKTKQVLAALHTYRWVHHFGFSQFIVVNIATARLFSYQSDSQYLDMAVVVGKPSTRTPRFATWCKQVVLYPYWNVPRSIAVKELLPKFKRSPAAVNAMNMQLIARNGSIVNPQSLDWQSFSSANFPYTIRQCTGCDNALGVIKFDLTDPFSVYLHDTNFKLAFGSQYRFHSHGCIRVSQPMALADWLLPGMIDSNFLNACIKGQEPVPLKLAQSVPVFVVYNTAHTSGDTVAYARDIYRIFKN